jgi:hypothetical protein
VLNLVLDEGLLVDLTFDGAGVDLLLRSLRKLDL